MAALLQPRTAMSLVAANREVDALIRGGVPVEYEAGAGPDAGKKVTERLRVIDFDTSAAQAGHNEYLAVTQLWVRGEKGYRRPDVLLYVNGLPLVFIELKNRCVQFRRHCHRGLLRPAHGLYRRAEGRSRAAHPRRTDRRRTGVV